jgi:hypothetical protein
MKLVGESVRPFMSAYLDEGFRDDEIDLERVDFSPSQIRADFKVRRAYMPLDGRFHLSATLAMNCIGQAGVVYAGLSSGRAERAGEIYLADLRIGFRKPVLTEEFTVDFLCKKRIERMGLVTYSGTGQVHDGCFVFEARFVAPSQAGS